VNLAKDSAIAIPASMLSGFGTLAIIYAGISIGAAGLEISIYSEDKIRDTVAEATKSIVGRYVGDTISMFTDPIIDWVFKKTKRIQMHIAKPMEGL
jgi:hypothetical protein